MPLILTTVLAITAACAPMGSCAAQDARTTTAINTSGGQLLDEQACFDVLHYDLVLEVMPENKSIEGVLTMTATVRETSREIALQLDSALTVRSVHAGLGDDLQPVTFTHEKGLMYIDAMTFMAGKGRIFKVAVEYGGTPRVAPGPPWDGGFTWSKSGGQPWIATTCQGEGGDVWWPCKDHPSDKPESVDLSFTVPEGLTVATNGRRVETVTAEGKTTSRWHVSTPIANYSISFNAGAFVELTRTMKSVAGDEIPIHFWVLKDDEEKGKAFMDEIVDHLTFFEETCGPYPFRADKYGVVQTPHLGMEHQTIIAYGNKFRGDSDFDYDWLHHHELAHEWWGNLVTAKDWADFWIHEGVGTYMQPLYLERKFGREAYEKKMRIDLLRVLNKAPVAPPAPRTTDSIYFAQDGGDAPGIDIYMKGSWVCHSLRWLLEDDVFFRVLRRWAYPDPKLEATTDGSATRFETTDGMRQIAESVAEVDLEWFFTVYLRRAALPELVHSVEDGVLTLEWRAPDGIAFPMPVEITVDGAARRIEMPKGRATVNVGKAAVKVDPNRRVLKKGG